MMTHNSPPNTTLPKHHPELRVNPDDPSAQPVLICKIRKGQELRVRCIAKKVNFLSTFTSETPICHITHTHKKTLWHSLMFDWAFSSSLYPFTPGHSEGARKMVSMFRGLLRIRPAQPVTPHHILVRNRHQKGMAIKYQRSRRRGTA